ncbi:hypothetical protein [Sciscionella sediminilitoris]|uniref:hypothetical protein n=1 Tax=Sciscionella sediminilitoris TaxID=1445613 RepID=UPI0012E0EDB2|nr:hypothetical protein [Sciscionella sp. SE31]
MTRPADLPASALELARVVPGPDPAAVDAAVSALLADQGPGWSTLRVAVAALNRGPS